ncbi:MAG: class I SAM-dependent methyltransferase [Thermoleophilia bacterium]|nr:class I SAM-dependent methyltransferase [Thermoleophilia bacterium]
MTVDPAAPAVPDSPYYDADLALIHHEGYGFHVDRTADGIFALLDEARILGGEHAHHILDVGCGSGLLAARLLAAGYSVTGIDASVAMIDLTRATAPDARACLVSLPGDAIPPASETDANECYDAAISTGHVLNYLPSREAIIAAIAAIGASVRSRGVIAFDLMTDDYCERPDIATAHVKVEHDWSIITTFERPTQHEFVRNITTFTRTPDGHFRRPEERHVNTTLDAHDAVAALEPLGYTCEVRSAFGDEPLPAGLVVIVARRD